MATIKDVARRAGVSIGTVDRILHNRGRFAPETARLVRQAIKELDYTPDIRARNLSLSRKCRIAVLMPHHHQDSEYWFLPYQGMKRALDELASSHVSADFFYFDRYDRSTFICAIEKMNENAYDGYIVSPLLVKETLERFRELFENVPVVFFDTDIEHSGRYTFVGQNSKDAGRLAAKLVDLLIGPTDRKVLIITPDTENEHLSYRLDGFVERIHASTQLLRISTETQKGLDGLEWLPAALRGEFAAVYVTDSSAHRVSRILERESLCASVSVVGFDLVPENVRFLEKGVIDFILTQRPIDQGMMAVRTLYRKIMLGLESTELQFVPIDIITRENMTTFIGMRDYL